MGKKIENGKRRINLISKNEDIPRIMDKLSHFAPIISAALITRIEPVARMDHLTASVASHETMIRWVLFPRVASASGTALRPPVNLKYPAARIALIKHGQ